MATGSKKSPPFLQKYEIEALRETTYNENSISYTISGDILSVSVKLVSISTIIESYVT